MFRNGEVQQLAQVALSLMTVVLYCGTDGLRMGLLNKKNKSMPRLNCRLREQLIVRLPMVLRVPF